MLTGGTFTVTAVTAVIDNYPFNAAVAIVGANLGNTISFTGDLVLHLVRLAVLRVDGTDQAIF